MNGLEFKSIANAAWGVAGLIAWSMAHFHILKKPDFRLNSKVIRKASVLTRLVTFLIGIAAWVLITYSMTLPRIPQGTSRGDIEANDIFMVLDVSRSMLAEDFNPNRLEVAKSKIIDFVSMFPKDRIGIIIFSEKVFTLLPVTTDLELIKQVVSEIRTGGPMGSGTNIGDALALAVARGHMSPAKNKIVILMSDGVSNVGSVTPLQAADMAKEAGMRVHTIAVGGDKDARIPVGDGIFGTQYQTIPGGGIDIEGLKKIAEITGGKSYRAKDEGALENVLQDIEQLEKAKIEVQGKVLYKEMYLGYFIAGLALLAIAELSRRYVFREAV